VIDGDIKSEIEKVWDSMGRRELDVKEARPYELKKYLLVLKEMCSKEKGGKRERRFLEKKRERITRDLNRLKKHSRLLEFAKSATEITDGKFVIGDTKFNFGHGKNFYQKREIIFNKIKSYKKAIPSLQMRLNDVLNEIEKSAEGGEKQLDLRNVKVIQPVMCVKEGGGLQVEGKNNYDVYRYNNLKIFVGKNADGNDQLRNKIGKKEDLWFHECGEKGAHIIVKTGHISDIGDQLFNILGSILIECGGGSKSEIMVLFTQLKNVRGLKGARGSVRYKKEKYRTCHYDKEWRQKINIEL